MVPPKAICYPWAELFPFFAAYIQLHCFLVNFPSMLASSYLVSLRAFFLSALLVLGAQVALAQNIITGSGPQGYDFMTVTTIESFRKAEAKMLLTPAFQGKTEIPLADGDITRLTANDITKITQNTLLVTQQLGALTAAGWELVQVYAVSPLSGAGYNSPITRYLLRRAKQ